MSDFNKISTMEFKDFLKQHDVDSFVGIYNNPIPVYHKECGYLDFVEKVNKVVTNNKEYISCPNCGHSIQGNYYYVPNYIYDKIEVMDDGSLIHKAVKFDLMKQRKVLMEPKIYPKENILRGTYLKDSPSTDKLDVHTGWEATRGPKYISYDDIISIENKYPHTGLLEFYMKHPTISVTDVIRYLSLYSLCPQVEQLVKCGYDHIIAEVLRCPNKIAEFSRCFKKGKNLKEILTVPKYVADYILESHNGYLKVFNEWRLMVKNNPISADMFSKYCTANLDKQKLLIFRKLINKGYYDMGSLLDYLNRVDMFQGIEPNAALGILNDYISMCEEMKVTPNTKSHSLKRDHDVILRSYTYYCSEETQQKFEARVPFFKSLEYRDKNFAIVAPSCTTDIVNEGRAMNNCVASYIKGIADGDSIVMFLRRTQRPRESYVTIEIFPDNLQVVQSYRRSNMRITDKNTLSFLNDYQEFLNKIAAVRMAG